MPIYCLFNLRIERFCYLLSSWLFICACLIFLNFVLNSGLMEKVCASLHTSHFCEASPRRFFPSFAFQNTDWKSDNSKFTNHSPYPNCCSKVIVEIFVGTPWVVLSKVD